MKEVQQLKTENEYLKNVSLSYGKEVASAEKVKVIQELRQRHSLELLLQIAELLQSTFLTYAAEM